MKFLHMPHQRQRIFFRLIIAPLIIGFCIPASQAFAQPTTQNPKPFAGQKISFLAIESHTGAAKALASWFHAETGAVVEITTIHYGALLEKILEDNAAPLPKVDVYMAWYVDLGNLVEMKALTDLTDFIESNRESLQPDDFIPAVYNAYTRYGGRRWGLPFDGDAHVLFYRKSLLKKYNLQPPESWVDYLHIAKTITENERNNGIYGCAIMAHPTPILIVSCFMNRLGSYGGRLMVGDKEPNINSPEALVALRDMIEQSAYALPTPTETDFAVARDAFLTGQVAMVEHWSDIGIMAEDVSQSLIRNDWGVVQMPRGKGVRARHAPALNAGFLLAVSSKAPHPDLAKAFMLFASRPDISLKLNLINGGVDPIRKSTLDSEEFKQFAPALSRVERSIVRHATPWPVVPQTPELMAALARLLTDALENRKTAKQALDETQRQWLRILETKAP